MQRTLRDKGEMVKSRGTGREIWSGGTWEVQYGCGNLNQLTPLGSWCSENARKCMATLCRVIDVQHMFGVLSWRMVEGGEARAGLCLRYFVTGTRWLNYIVRGICVIFWAKDDNELWLEDECEFCVENREASLFIWRFMRSIEASRWNRRLEIVLLSRR